MNMTSEMIKCRLCGNVFDKDGNNKMLNCCDRVLKWHSQIEKHVEKESESEKDFMVC